MPILPLPNSRSAGQADLSLATSGGVGPSGAVAHPFFFSGFVAQPAVSGASAADAGEGGAHAVLCAAQYPGGGAAGGRSGRDVHARGLRFESFSVCCGVYARLDVDAAALDATHVAPGVTNVDVNPPLRQALAGLRASEPLHLNVGSDALRVSTGAGEIVEERCRCPALAQGFCRDADAVGGHGVPPCADGGGPAPVRAGAAAVIVDQDRDVGDPGGPLAAAGHAGDARRGLRGGAGAAARAGALVALCHRAARLARRRRRARCRRPAPGCWSCPARGSRWV